MASTRLADHLGRVLGSRYRLSAAIGTGASAHVFLAEDVRLGRRVAVKVLHPALADDAAFIKRFRAEARAAAALNHPNIMAVYDWGEEPDGPFIVSEFLGGGSLRAMLDRGNRLTPSQALMVGLEAARGLDYAHRRGLVHRDIKPANLLFDEEGRLRIADFGLARALAEAAWTEPSGAVLGTARYASPEQVRGVALDGKADVYSLALVLVEAVTGRVPFAADTTVGTIMGRLERPLAVPAELGSLAPVLARAGLPDPATRPDAMAFGAGLHSLAASMPSPEPLPLAGPAVFDEALVVLDRDPTEMGVGTTAAGGEPTVANGVPTSPADATLTMARPEPGPSATAATPALVEAKRAKKVKPAKAERPSRAGRRHRRWPLIVLAVLVALVGSTVGAVALVRAQVQVTPVPDVHGQPISQVEPALKRLGFHISELPKFVDDQGAGTVVDQSPVPNTKLKEGKTVSLTVSQGPTPVDVVPDLTSKTVDQATTALAAVSLTIGKQANQYSETVQAGTVIDWNPKTNVHHGDSVDLTVSSGPQPRTIPDLTSMTLDQAVAAIQALNLVVSQDSRFDDVVPKDKIIGTRPPVGTQVDRNTTVVIVTSKGQPVVPSLTGKSAADAKTLLEANDLKLGNVYGPSGGAVVLANPSAGSKEKRGTSVDIYLI